LCQFLYCLYFIVAIPEDGMTLWDGNCTSTTLQPLCDLLALAIHW